METRAVRMKIGEYLLKVSDRRDSKHIGPQRGGMRKPFAIPPKMFAHPPKLALPTSRFEPPGMIEQHLEADVERRSPRFEPILRALLLQNESRFLLLPKEPGGS